MDAHAGTHHDHGHHHSHGDGGCCSHGPHDHAAHADAGVPQGDAVQPAPLKATAHGHGAGDEACDCAGHRMQARRGTGEKLSGLSAILPILACALCPVCLSAYATILSALGVGLAITEGQHAILLGVAVVLALVSGVWRARLTRYYGPLATTAAGCALLILGDLLKENRPVTFLGMGVLLIAMVWDRRATARRRAEASAGLAAA